MLTSRTGGAILWYASARSLLLPRAGRALAMAFDADIQHWPTISAFTAYLRTVPRPAWVRGLVNHNTYRPNEDQWVGRRSVEGCMQTYIDKGWESGPHLFVAASAPNAPSATGIWQLTPITRPGTHAGACNATRLGIEHVGDFDAAPPSAAQFTLLIAINRAILEHWGMPPESVLVHNECMTGRVCPGKYLTGTQIRTALQSMWPTDPFARWGDIGKPTGEATQFAVPRAWLVNKALGRCVEPETYSHSGKYSVTEFEHGLIWYLKAKNSTRVELF